MRASTKAALEAYLDDHPSDRWRMTLSGRIQLVAYTLIVLGIGWVLINHWLPGLDNYLWSGFAAFLVTATGLSIYSLHLFIVVLHRAMKRQKEGS